jgi:hypothetical protein
LIVIIKTRELIGPALDWAVGVSEGKLSDLAVFGGSRIVWYGRQTVGYVPYCPAENWSQGGPIIDRERISIRTYANPGHPWVAFIDFGGSSVSGVKAKRYGPTPLIAAMRCYVASKLGDEVDVPEELL